MANKKNKSHIKIKVADKENIIDFNLCAHEFIDFIKNFRKKFINKKFFILTAYYDGILAGLLVAEDKSKKINSFEKLIPSVYLHLIFVNPNFRNKNLGKELLNSFINIQKKKGIASILVRLPQGYKKGVQFFLKNGFHISKKDKTKISLELNLWNDYGIRECSLIYDDSNSFFL
ncbi:MAG: GNAT family N-acetyltransferase [Promethearchaeota archaeon]|nr:MAG: GNAT family N-acetyltransferase [Candidatus Lokiarchaeota archaeon]